MTFLLMEFWEDNTIEEVYLYEYVIFMSLNRCSKI